MTDYADAGYQLQHYKITFYADNNGKIPLKSGPSCIRQL